ncbi:MAG: phosphotransferase enzyme family protein [Novosphingobium sp.]
MLDIEAYFPAAQAALQAFGMASAALAPVSMSENAVFRVTDTAGAIFALRLHRPGYHARDALDSERMLTAMLAAKGMIVPTGQRTSDGAWYAAIATPDPEGWRHAGLTVWHEGHTLESRIGEDRGPATWHWFESAGALLAELHTHTESWSPTPGFVRHRLDMEGLVGEAPFWGRFWQAQSLNVDERQMLGTARDLARARLTELARAELARGNAPFGLIHADAHPGNILISGSESHSRLGLIDFDDCAWGWHAFDMAVALRSASGKPRFKELRDRFLAGYETRRALPGGILQQLDLFLLVRALTLVIWCEMRPDVVGESPEESWKPGLLDDIRQAMGAVA